jgi:hypothetical protein
VKGKGKRTYTLAEVLAPAPVLAYSSKILGGGEREVSEGFGYIYSLLCFGWEEKD